MVVGTPAGGPEILAVGFDNRQVVDAGDAPAHQAVLVELPELVAIGAEPLAAVVMPFVGEAHRHAVVAKPPQLLDEPVVEFLVPFAGQERANGLPALDELDAIAPFAAYRISQRHPRRIAAIPGILGQTDFLHRRFRRERRQRRTFARIHAQSPVAANSARSALFSDSSASRRERNGASAGASSASLNRCVICCGQFESNAARRMMRLRSTLVGRLAGST